MYVMIKSTFICLMSDLYFRWWSGVTWSVYDVRSTFTIISANNNTLHYTCNFIGKTL